MLESPGLRPAYRHCGGDILARADPIAPPRARELYAFFLDCAEACLAAGDAAGARYCARTAVELTAALRAWAAWRRASGRVI